MSFMADFDAWLIAEKSEPFSWKIEYRFGKDCFWLTKACTLIIFVLFALLLLCFKRALAEVLSVPLPWSASDGLIVAGTFLLYIATYMGISITAREVRKNPSVMNPMKEAWIFRTFVSVFSVLTVMLNGFDEILGLITFFLLLSCIAALYFWACNPMPPGWKPKKKVTDVIEQGT